MNKTHKKPKITLLEGKRNLDKLSSRRQPLYSLWSEYGDDTDFSASPLNKGKAGQVVELLIGLQNSSDSVDFLDGELKTSGMKERNGVIVPDQTVAVAQIGTRIDDLLFNPQFEKSFLYEKIKSLLLVPIVQPDKKDRSGWYLAPAIHIDIIKDKELLTQLEEDFHLICEKMMKSIKLDGRIHTTNAHYLQIRSKDSKPYHPITSKKLKREVSNKNYAFYFRRGFLLDALAGKFSF